MLCLPMGVDVIGRARPVGERVVQPGACGVQLQ